MIHCPYNNTTQSDRHLCSYNSTPYPTLHHSNSQALVPLVRENVSTFAPWACVIVMATSRPRVCSPHWAAISHWQYSLTSASQQRYLSFLPRMGTTRAAHTATTHGPCYRMHFLLHSIIANERPLSALWLSAGWVKTLQTSGVRRKIWPWDIDRKLPTTDYILCYEHESQRLKVLLRGGLLHFSSHQITQ